MEKYFDIRYEFDVPTVHKAIDQQIASGKPGYICVADGMDAQTAPRVRAPHIRRTQETDKTLLGHRGNIAKNIQQREKSEEK